MMRKNRISLVRLFLLTGLFLAASFFVPNGHADSKSRMSKGQTVYVPVYSHVFHTDKERPFDLTATLSIRSADFAHPIKIVSVDYYDSNGKRLKSYLDKPVKLAPMASIHDKLRLDAPTFGRRGKARKQPFLIVSSGIFDEG